MRRTTRLIFIAVALTMILIPTTPGCVTRILTGSGDAAKRLERAPRLTVETTNDKHLVVMEAPSPGWSIRLDATERTPDGKRVFLTIREPDPLLEYTQQIVLKRVLTNVRADTPLELSARLLEHDEKTKGRDYAPIEPVESFDE